MIMQNSISNQRCRLQRVRVASYISVSINPTLLKSMKNYHDTKHLNCCDWVLQNLSFVTNPTYTLINIQTNNIVVRTRPGYRMMLRGPTRLQHVSSKSISVEINHRLNFHNTICTGRHFQKPNVPRPITVACGSPAISPRPDPRPTPHILVKAREKCPIPTILMDWRVRNALYPRSWWIGANRTITPRNEEVVR
jgi:hypothetical protein